MVRPFVYITAAWSGNKEGAKEAAETYCRRIYEAGYAPVCPILFLGDYLNPESAEEVKDYADMAAELLRRSRMLAVCGNGVDAQVKSDIALAKRLRITATTLDGIMKVEGKGKKTDEKR